MELRDLSNDEMDSLFQEIQVEGQRMARQSLIDESRAVLEEGPERALGEPLRPEYQGFPEHFSSLQPNRERPELRAVQPDVTEQILSSLGRRTPDYSPDTTPDGRPLMRSRERTLGDHIRDVMPGSEAYNRFGDVVDYLGQPYQVSSAQFAEDGIDKFSEGVEEGKPLKALGGAGMVGLTALPFAGRAAGQMFATIPRSLGTGAAVTTAPLLAEEAFDASPAYAAGERGLGEELVDKGKSLLPRYALSMAPYAAALGAGKVSGLYANRLAGQEALKRQQRSADSLQVGRNRETIQNLQRNTDDVPLQNSLQDDLMAIEPAYYKGLSQAQIARQIDKDDKVQRFIADNRDGISVSAGALGGGLAGYSASEGDPEATAYSTFIGALGGRRGKLAPPKTVKSRVPRLNPDETLRKRGLKLVNEKDARGLTYGETMSQKAKRQKRKGGKFVKGYNKDSGDLD